MATALRSCASSTTTPSKRGPAPGAAERAAAAAPAQREVVLEALDPAAGEERVELVEQQPGVLREVALEPVALDECRDVAIAHSSVDDPQSIAAVGCDELARE